MRLITILILSLQLGATDAVDNFGIPNWILPGILMVETGSSYQITDGTIVVGSHKRGAAGESGVFQIRHSAFNMVSKRSEVFRELATDTAFNERIAARYLWYLHDRYGSWVNAIQAYNAGRPCRAGRRYLNRVYRVMGMQ